MSTKSTLQGAIDNGSIRSIEALLARVAALGLQITRNGTDYMGMMTADGSRFRVRYEFPNSTRPIKAEKQGQASRSSTGATRARNFPVSAAVNRCVIYALIARPRSQGRIGCYIGLTMEPKTDFDSLVDGRIDGVGGALFAWAGRHHANVYVVALENPITHDAQSDVRVREHWTWLAVENGFDVVGALSPESALPLTNPRGRPMDWPTSKVIAREIHAYDVLRYGHSLHSTVHVVRRPEPKPDAPADGPLTPDSKLEHCIDIEVGEVLADADGVLYQHTHVRRNSKSLEFHFNMLGDGEAQHTSYSLWRGALRKFPGIVALLKPQHAKVQPDDDTDEALEGIDDEPLADPPESSMTAGELAAKYTAFGGEHPALPRAIWIEKVNHGNVVDGYWPWVQSEIEVAAEGRSLTRALHRER